MLFEITAAFSKYFGFFVRWIIYVVFINFYLFTYLFIIYFISLFYLLIIIFLFISFFIELFILYLFFPLGSLRCSSLAGIASAFKANAEFLKQVNRVAHVKSLFMFALNKKLKKLDISEAILEEEAQFYYRNVDTGLDIELHGHYRKSAFSEDCQLLFL